MFASAKWAGLKAVLFIGSGSQFVLSWAVFRFEEYRRCCEATGWLLSKVTISCQACDLSEEMCHQWLVCTVRRWYRQGCVSWLINLTPGFVVKMLPSFFVLVGLRVCLDSEICEMVFATQMLSSLPYLAC